MRSHTVSCIAFAAGLVAMTAQADHNSIWGDGWANMPNDIHNTRIESMDDDTDAFIDFVRMGSGSETARPYAADTNTVGGNDQGGGGLSQLGTRGGRS